MSSATVLVAANLLKALAILIKTTVRRSVVDQEHIKPCWKKEKGNISLCDQQSYYLQVFQTDGLFCFISICKFSSFKNPFKIKWFLWTMGAAQAAENHGDEWGLTWYLRWGIYSQGVIQAEAEVGHWFWDSWVWDPKLSNSKRKKQKKKHDIHS